MDELVEKAELPSDAIAIIGMAGRFPGARDIGEFWGNLLAGRDTISHFTPEQDESRSKAVKDPDYVPARGVLDDVAMFDAEYFGISPREAERMDPQHRLLLEACSNALEDAGYVSSEYTGEIGLFAGCSLNTYLLANLATDRTFLDELTGNYQVGEFASALGNDKDMLTTRAAYKLNLRGPCVTVQSACATSLVAVCQASQSLLNYQCDMALAGGVSATFPQRRGHIYQEGGIVSKDGVCRPFDAAATGTVFGHGVGVVLLKRLDEAVRDGDHIEAVIRGFAVNNDGSAKAGYMAPGIEGQASVIAAAQAMAGVAPETISCVEAHGTATPLGDPIEVAALTRTFRARGATGSGFCAIGTAKGNIGHLDSAAGVTGVIKTALSLRERTLPPLAHFESANPHIDFAATPFYVNRAVKRWVADGPLRAGVSAFGVGGVNAHVVMEEAPAVTSVRSVRPRQVLCLSSRTERGLAAVASELGEYLAAHPDTALDDAAYTLSIGRRAHAHRLSLTAATAGDAGRLLLGGKGSVGKSSAAGRLAMVFSGQGSQFAGMGAELYANEPVYRAVVDECSAMLPFDLRAVMFGAGQDEALQETWRAQPALFVTELALARLWQSWGITPEVVAGHSVGEYAAAVVAGVMSQQDALHLVAARGQLMGEMERGAMVSVALGEQAVQRYTSEKIEVAGLNSPRASVLAGTIRAIEDLERQLEADGVAFRRLRTSHAFHSAMMEPMLVRFEAEVRRAALKPPSVGFVSTVTGIGLTAAETTDPMYWVRQCRNPVRFADATATLWNDKTGIVLEVGPGETLTTLTMQQRGAAEAVVVASLPRPAKIGEAKTVYDAFGALWAAGVSPNWPGYYKIERRRRVSLPTYPFERKLHWIEPPPRSSVTDVAIAPESVSMPAAEVVSFPVTSSLTPRSVSLQPLIASVFGELSGIEIAPDEFEHPFLELGFDSLFLTQATQALSKKFGVKLTFRQLMEQFPTIASLAGHLHSVLPEGAFAAETAPIAAVTPARVQASAPGVASSTEQLLAAQLAALSSMFAEQVATLRATAGLVPAGFTAGLTAGLTTAVTAGVTTAVQPVAPANAASASPAVFKSEATEVKHGSYRPLQPKVTHQVTADQERYLAKLIAGYEAKTPGSKRATAEARGYLADPRAVAGFRPQWKEMVYPLVVERAQGSKLWDVDGNEYIDIVNGYGAVMFGHSPQFVVDAATAQLGQGVAIGPQSPLAGEVAKLICELTGNERVTFCNTGSEAVMAALRVARTVTGRDRIVYFAGDYHGTFDEVLVRNTPRGTAPLAPGIPTANVGNIVVLDYGSENSLTYLRDHCDEIAAVLVEPVQTRNPALQPVEFVREVRRITEEHGAALILDEVVTGFRLAPGGAQEVFGIRADMATYGKVIGGGHPIGVLSGKAQYLDALDGGGWQYGDNSGPEVGVTFFAGTFVRHPLALAAARSVLLHLKQNGPRLQAELNGKTKALAETLDAFFVERGVPSRIHHFASWFYFTFSSEARLGSLLYYAMRAKGIHIQEGYPCFLTTAHTDADLVAVERAFKETVIEMQAAKVLPGGAVVPSYDVLHADALPVMPGRVPLTEPQREIFLSAALDDQANCAYNESVQLRLTGPIRFADLERAIETGLNRHDALRGAVSEDGEWFAIAEVPAGRRTELIDVQRFSAGEREAMLAERIALESRTPFALHTGPLVRTTLLRFSAEEAVLVLAAHHIVLDGWSANQVLEDIGRFYSGAAGGRFEPLMPFSSYAMSERKRELAGEFAANEQYWVERFAGRAPVLQLPTDRPRPLEKNYAGSTLDGALGSELYAALKKASAAAGCSLYVTLLSGFQLLLHRLTGQEEVVSGISTAGQALIEDASLVGHCVHFLPMLSQINVKTSGAEYLRATRTHLLDAYDHQEFTFGSLLRKLKLAREPGRLPLIEVQFNLERMGARVNFDGLSSTMMANAKQFVNTDLFLNVVETDTDLRFSCDFNTGLFDEATVRMWLRCWATLLESLARDSSGPVVALPMLAAQDRAEMMRDPSETATSFGRFEPVSETVLRRARVTPEQVALECGGARWSYRTLADAATKVAHCLLAEGLRPGDLVAIGVERSPEMLVAMLGVMLAGGAYLPLDPRHPAERLAMVLDDAGVSLLLAGREWISDSPRIKLLRVHEITLNSVSPSPLPEAAGASDLAYVIYTSGSTGRPKGVAVGHGALFNLLRSMEREPGLTGSDTLVAITTLAFDIAALELLLPLVTGARLVIATDNEVGDGGLLLSLLKRSGATALQATPGMWRVLLEAGWTGQEPKLKALCGGEALPRDLADQLLGFGVEVWNMYGPTETTIWSSATRVQAGAGPLRLGLPIANTQFYVLDDRSQLVPEGVSGELCIGGTGLAQGYWNRPELTAEKFITDPFGEGRLYRTGDLARRQGHEIELLGRTDFQVKVRGYRVELGEIEAELTKHAGVREAVVVQQTGKDGVKRLVGYVATAATHAQESAKLIQELRQGLFAALPGYMVPNAIVALERLPRTPNGKVDRKALPETDETVAGRTAEKAKEFTPARTTEERKLVTIWSEILQVPEIGVHDSIFELGADSLLIFRIAARAQREGMPLKATHIFQQRTIAGLSTVLAGEPASAPVPLTTRIVAASRERFRTVKAGADE